MKFTSPDHLMRARAFLRPYTEGTHLHMFTDPDRSIENISPEEEVLVMGMAGIVIELENKYLLTKKG